MNNQTERQLFRIQLLKIVAEKSEFNPEKMVYPKEIMKMLSGESKDDLISNSLYLSDKQYLNVLPLKHSGGVSDIAWIKITSFGIDLVEKLNDGRNLEDYFSDFPPSILINIQQGNQSQLSLFSNNINQSIQINESSNKKILELLDEIKNKEENPTIKDTITSIETEIKKDKINWEKVSGMIQILLSISSIAAQIFTPEIRELLKISY